jgi:hypothetical protein
MLGLLEKIAIGSRERRRHLAARAAISCEGLEDRQLLSAGMGLSGYGNDFPHGGGSIAAERGSIGIARQDGMFGGGSFGLGGGARNPILFLTAPLVGTSSSTPPSPGVMSSSAVQSAFQTLQTDLKNDIPSSATPTHASVGALQDDLDAIHKGTLSGTAAQTKIQADQAAILTSTGLTSAQVAQIQSDQSALQTAIQTASSSSSTSTSTSTSTTTPTMPNAPSSAVQTAMNTLQTDLKTDTPSGAQATHAAIGTVQDDLDAIRKGTLTGSAALTQVQTDAAAVLASMGLTPTQISQIQADQTAVQTAMANSSSSASPSTSTSTSTTESTLQSVTGYLIGIPGLQSGGMRGFGGFGDHAGPGGFGGFGGSGFGAGPRGGF